MGAKTHTSELLPGTLDLLILRTLVAGEMHGYGIAQRLKQVSDEIQTLHKMRPVPQDRFVFVMQPFISSMGSVVESLKNMSTTLDTELKGEVPCIYGSVVLSD